MATATDLTMDEHVKHYGLKGGLLCLSVDLANLAKHPDCTEAQRELILAARDTVWRASWLETAKSEAEAA